MNPESAICCMHQQSVTDYIQVAAEGIFTYRDEHHPMPSWHSCDSEDIDKCHDLLNSQHQ